MKKMINDFSKIETILIDDDSIMQQPTAFSKSIFSALEQAGYSIQIVSTSQLKQFFSDQHVIEKTPCLLVTNQLENTELCQQAEIIVASAVNRSSKVDYIVNCLEYHRVAQLLARLFLKKSVYHDR